MTPTESRLRIEELELLCRDVFTVGVELGLPQSLLKRLWRVHAGDSRGTSFNLDLMDQPVAPRAGTPSLDAPPRPPL